MKTCTKCKIPKELNEFTNKSSTKDGKISYCKDCGRIITKRYYLQNKQKIKGQALLYYKNNVEEIKKLYSCEGDCREKRRINNVNYRINNPWMSSYIHAKQRCVNPNCDSYKTYGGRGIKFLLSKEDAKQLWFRDKAWLLDRPSIDRIENDGNYCYENCQFIELVDNCKKKKADRA